MAAGRVGPPWPRSPRRARRNPRRKRRGRLRARAAVAWAAGPGGEAAARSVRLTHSRPARSSWACARRPAARRRHESSARELSTQTCRPSAPPRTRAGRLREDVAFSRVPAQRCIALSWAGQETAGVGRENSRSARRASCRPPRSSRPRSRLGRRSRLGSSSRTLPEPEPLHQPSAPVALQRPRAHERHSGPAKPYLACLVYPHSS